MDRISSFTKECPHCGERINIDARRCEFCGEYVADEQQPAMQAFISNPSTNMTPQPNTQVIVNQVTHRSNGMGTAGFILSLICALFSWLPGVNAILWFLGLLFSFIGLFKRPRGLAIVGFLISTIDLILIGAVLGGIASILGSLL